MRHSTWVVTLSLLLGGCNAVRTADQGIAAEIVRADTLEQTIQTAKGEPAPSDGVTVHTGSMFTGKPIRHGQGLTLPTSWVRASIQSGETPVTLTFIAEVISRKYGVPAVLLDGADQPAGAPPRAMQIQASSLLTGGETRSVPRSGGNEGQPGTSDLSGLRGTLLAAMNANAGSSQVPSAGQAQADRHVINSPPLEARDLLNFIAGQFDVSWRYRNGRLEFYRFVTESFTLEAMPLSVSMSTGSSSGSALTGGGSGSGIGGTERSGNSAGAFTLGGSGGGGAVANGPSSGGSAGQAISLNYYADLEQQLQAQLPADARYAVNQSNGRLVVVARPQVIDRVRQLVALENRTSAKEVMIVMEILSIDVSDRDEFGLDLEAIYRGGGLEWSLDGSPPSLSNDVGSLSAGVVRGGSRWSGSSMAAKAIAERSKGAVTRTFTGSGQSNSVISVRQVDKTDVLRSIQTVIVPDVGTVSNAQTEPVTTGLDMTALPRVLPDGRIRLLYALSLSSLVDLIREELGEGNAITRSVSSANEHTSLTTLRSGESIVLTGIVERSAQRRDRGMGAAMPLLGGSITGETGRRQFFVVITPVER